jgi:hypothetical protein
VGLEPLERPFRPFFFGRPVVLPIYSIFVLADAKKSTVSPAVLVFVVVKMFLEVPLLYY